MFSIGYFSYSKISNKMETYQFKGKTHHYIINQNSLPTRLIHSVTVWRLALPASNHWGKRWCRWLVIHGDKVHRNLGTLIKFQAKHDNGFIIIKIFLFEWSQISYTFHFVLLQPKSWCKSCAGSSRAIYNSLVLFSLFRIHI